MSDWGMPENRRTWCNQCGGMTTHDQLFSTWRRSEEKEFPAWIEANETLACGGCGSVTFRRRSMNEEYLEDDGKGHGVPTLFERHFPPRVSRPEPAWLSEVDWSVYEVMNEVYAALHSDLRSLAGMGARAVIERIMTDKVGPSGSFVARLERMVTDKIITEDQKVVLEVALDLGHATNHRGMRPSAKQLGTTMDIIENLLQTLYVLPEEAAELRKKIPPRK